MATTETFDDGPTVGKFNVLS